MFDTLFESDLENCDLEDQISASHKWDGGHERVGFSLFFFRLCDSAKEHENEDCSELLLKQNTFLKQEQFISVSRIVVQNHL